jgi:hypothetical protein
MFLGHRLGGQQQLCWSFRRGTFADFFPFLRSKLPLAAPIRLSFALPLINGNKSLLSTLNGQPFGHYPPMGSGPIKKKTIGGIAGGGFLFGFPAI